MRGLTGALSTVAMVIAVGFFASQTVTSVLQSTITRFLPAA